MYIELLLFSLFRQVKKTTLSPWKVQLSSARTIIPRGWQRQKTRLGRDNCRRWMSILLSNGKRAFSNTCEVRNNANQTLFTRCWFRLLTTTTSESASLTPLKQIVIFAVAFDSALSLSLSLSLCAAFHSSVEQREHCCDLECSFNEWMEASLLRLPSILPSSNSLISSDRPLTVKLSRTSPWIFVDVRLCSLRYECLWTVAGEYSSTIRRRSSTSSERINRSNWTRRTTSETRSTVILPSVRFSAGIEMREKGWLTFNQRSPLNVRQYLRVEKKRKEKKRMQQLVSRLSCHWLLKSSNEDSQRDIEIFIEDTKHQTKFSSQNTRCLLEGQILIDRHSFLSLSRWWRDTWEILPGERERRKSKFLCFERWPLPFDWKASISIFLLRRLELVNRHSPLPRKLSLRSRSTIAGVRSIVTIIMFFIQFTAKVVNHRPDVSLSIHHFLEHPRKAFNSVLPLLLRITDNNNNNNDEMNKQHRTWTLQRIWLNISPNNLHWPHSTVIHRFSSATVSSNRTKRRFSMHSNTSWSTEKNQRPMSIDMAWASRKMDPSGRRPFEFFIPHPSYSIEILSAKNCIFLRRPIVGKPSTINLLCTNTPMSSNMQWSSTTWIRPVDNSRLRSTTTNTCVLNWSSSRDSKEEIFVKSNECKSSFPWPWLFSLSLS